MQELLDDADHGAKAQEDRERSERREQMVVADFKWLLSSTRGRRIVWRLLEEAGVFRLSFTNDTSVTAFNEGRRAYGLKVLGMLHDHSPEAYPKMLEEKSKYE